MKTKHRCIICLGSNTESEYHMNWAEEILSDLFSHAHSQLQYVPPFRHPHFLK